MITLSSYHDTVLYDVLPCSGVGAYRRFGGAPELGWYTGYSETSVSDLGKYHQLWHDSIIHPYIRTVKGDGAKWHRPVVDAGSSGQTQAKWRSEHLESDALGKETSAKSDVYTWILFAASRYLRTVRNCQIEGGSIQRDGNLSNSPQPPNSHSGSEAMYRYYHKSVACFLQWLSQECRMLLTMTITRV
jgi:hypothetical protein